MPHEVRVYNKHGRLVKTIPSEKLSYIDDEKQVPQRLKGKAARIVYCEFCGDPVKAWLDSRTTCKKSKCVMKKVERRKAGREKMKGGLLARTEATV